jgi:carboxyl-terminal processing protease
MSGALDNPAAKPITLRTLVLGIAFGVALGIVLDRAAQKSPSQSPSFQRAKQQIHEHYLGDIDNAALERGAIKGMVNTLDDHSELLTPEAYERLLKESQGSFVGVGLEIGLERGFFTVLSTLVNSPAEAQDIQPGDRIKTVDGKSVQGKLLRELVAMLRGKQDTEVAIGFSRKVSAQSSESYFELTLKRTKLTGVYLQTEMVAERVMHVKAAQCYDGLAEDLVRAVTAHKNPPITGLILDLRNNPGGTLNCAVATADLFLDSGKIVTTAAAQLLPEAAGAVTYPAGPTTPLKALPTVILVNAGTASAAEIIAGALQDHGRAKIVGSQTFAKGTVQSLLPPLANGSALKITTGIYLTPNGRTFNEQGLVPDVLLTEGESAVTRALAMLAKPSLVQTSELQDKNN